ncbi:MAG TPA: sigma-70 family RNA polymerase sigma factor [Acidimicrobiia bacterium]|nr:sigma-70 family RNA polymerase sigma factor [Acidimicrobiia bacterium]
MTTPGTEADLLARVISGDRGAFDSIMRVQENRVFSVCLRILGNRENALDATQETFLTVFRKAAQFKGDSALGTWIYRIAVNTCYDQIRKSARKPTESIPDHLEPPDASAEDAIEAAGLRPEIERALAGLPPEFRAAVVLSDLEGMSLPETAEVLGIPVGTVKSRVFRGRRLLAERLGNQTMRSDHQRDTDA